VQSFNQLHAINHSRKESTISAVTGLFGLIASLARKAFCTSQSSTIAE
jgi:hypothetical protein